MPPAQGKARQASQQAWVAFRQKEIETQAALDGALPGGRWFSAAATRRLERSRDRARQLRADLEALADR